MVNKTQSKEGKNLPFFAFSPPHWFLPYILFFGTRGRFSEHLTGLCAWKFSPKYPLCRNSLAKSAMWKIPLFFFLWNIGRVTVFNNIVCFIFFLVIVHVLTSLWTLPLFLYFVEYSQKNLHFDIFSEMGWTFSQNFSSLAVLVWDWE